jgi:hypothetical protein
MARSIDYLARVVKADERFKADQERLARSGEARRRAIGDAVAAGVKIDAVAEVLGGLNYESVRRIAAEINGPRPPGRPKGT